MICQGCDDQRWRRLVARRHLLAAGLTVPMLGLQLSRAEWIALAQEATPTAGGRVRFSPETHDVTINESFISPLVELYGNIEVGQRSFVAGNTILYAGEEQLLSLGDENNCQDNAYLLATAANTRFGNMVSIAHQAVIEDSVIGDFTFFGFRSRTRHCEIGAGSMIMHNTTVENVVIPPNRITPVGTRITTQADADALPEVTEANDEFKHAVQHVNVEFAASYTALYEQFGRSAVEGISRNPVTGFNPESIEPTIGDDTVLAELVRIVGDVRLGEGSTVGQRTAIRADEGTPIIIGRRARIGSRVTFHALEHTSLEVGDNALIGDSCVIHGPLIMGSSIAVGDEAVVFQATIEDNVTIERGATIAGAVTIREGAIVPTGAVITTQEEADALPIS
jgi:carbonic anhydrase/acetyltransferase-like protein (isoleucine patch superfamily)